MKPTFGKQLLFIFAGILLCILFCPNDVLFGQPPIVDSLKEKTDPFAKPKTRQGSGGQLTDFVDPKERDRIRAGADVPKVDNYANIEFQLPEDKDPDEMTEDDLYKTITPAETVILTPAPKTGAELFRAGVLIASAGRPQYSRLCFKKIVELEKKDEKNKIKPEEYARVIDELGFNRVLYLVNNTAVGPIGTAAAIKSFEEARKVWEDPQLLAAAVKRYSKGSISEKAASLIAIRKGGAVAIQILLKDLSSSNADESRSAADLLELLGEPAIEPLIVFLVNCAEEKVEIQIVEILSRLVSAQIPDLFLALYYDNETSSALRTGALKEGIIRYFGKVPSLEAAFARLNERAWNCYRQKIAVPQLINNRTPVWIWDNDAQNVSVQEQTLAEYNRTFSAFWSRAAWRIGKTLKDKAFVENSLALALAAVSEESLYKLGLDKPIDTTSVTEEFPMASAADFERALALTLTEKRFKGGIIPTIQLAKSGSPDFCYSKTELPSPLVQAASSSDRRLRFTALSAISRLNPSKSYTGVSRIMPALIQFTTSNGAKKVVIAAPHLDDALRNGNIFNQIGYSIVPVTTGGNIVQQVQSDADIELVAALSSVKTPEMFTVAQILAKDYRTADIPLLIGADAISYSRTVSEQTRKRLDPFHKEVKIPFEADTGVVLESYSPGIDRVLVEIWAVRVGKQKIDSGEVKQEISDKIVSSPELKKKLNAPLLVEIETDARINQATNPGNDFPNTLALALPYDQQSAQWIVSQLFEKTNMEPVPAAIRKAQAKAAAGMLIRLHDSHPDIYVLEDLIFLVHRMLVSDFLFDEGLQLAMQVPTAEVQKLLTSMIGDVRIPIQKREDILLTFTEHLDKFGSKLRGPDVLVLYERYNSSEGESKEDQKLLSDMLDAYERIAKKNARQ